MSKTFDKINTIEDLRKFSTKEKQVLAEELREEILETVSKTGGHLASNLGVVELTIAIHSVFDTPKDKLVWDVGHQSYVHKMLTGRRDKMNTLRQLNGISGFPKMEESEFDNFETGHSSTSISAALGMARSFKLHNQNNKAIAIIGDGALTGGMALEALNDAGSSDSDIIVILNDNEMSISKNVGGVSALLTKIRTKRIYTRSNKKIRELARKIPKIGNGLVSGARKLKTMIKQISLHSMYFEDIGFTYLGPVDGHNIEKVESLLSKAKELKGPIVVHVITKKGKGYKIAEDTPDKFHGIGEFDVLTGQKKGSNSKDYSKVFGDKLIELAKKDRKIVAITAAMPAGTGLTEFSNLFKDRFFDVGIAEQHALGMAAGMASAGLKPVVPIYSSFLQRGYDQIIHDICMQNLPVVICIDRGGIVGNDGETHQGVFDLSFLSCVPNLTIMAPKNFLEMEMMLEKAVNLNRPVCIRYPRGGEGNFIFDTVQKIEEGYIETIKTGNDVTILAIGNMVSRVMEALEIESEIDAEVINIRFLKPLDKVAILNSILKTKKVITIEDNVEKGGLGSSIQELIIENKLDIKEFRKISYPLDYIKQGSVVEIEKKYGIDKENVARIIKEICEEI